MKLVIKQRFDQGTTGNEANVTRVMRSNHRVYVEVKHTQDASERVIMVAVDKALKDYGIQDLESIDGRKEEDTQQDSEA